MEKAFMKMEDKPNRFMIKPVDARGVFRKAVMPAVRNEVVMTRPQQRR